MAKKTNKNVVRRIIITGIFLMGIILALREIWQKDLGIVWELLEAGNSSSKTDEVALCESVLCENYHIYRYPAVVTTSVFAKAETDKSQTLKKLIEDHALEIKDNIRTTVASARHWEITDPKLDVIIRQMKIDVERIVGKDMINKILIPVWHVSRQ